MYEDRILCPELREKVKSVEEAANMIEENMVVAFSGFAAVGYPKQVPLEIAKIAKAKNLTIFAGASTGDEVDGALSRANLISFKAPFNVNKDLRDQINSGQVNYADYHLGNIPQMIHSEAFGKIDYAIIECSGIREDGSVVPVLSIGTNNTFLQYAEHIILELNLRHSDKLYGIHDVYDVGKLPTDSTIPIINTGDRIGCYSMKCPIEKVSAVVVVNDDDREPRFLPTDDVSEKIAQNIIKIIKKELDDKKIPENFTIQSGFGAVANAVLYGLNSDEFGTINMYTEIIQDGALDLILKGKIGHASATSLNLSKASREVLYNNLDYFKEHICLRPQDVSNNGAVIRRLGVIAMNTVIECDIYGNVNSTHIMGSSMMNGIGGSNDYGRNGYLSIFMTPSTAKNGLISSIVPMCSHVDTTEHDVQIIVTEWGYADLRGKSPKERAELIIENCSHPDYKPMLREYFEDAKKVSYGKHTPHNLKKALSWHQRYLDTGSMKECNC